MDKNQFRLGNLIGFEDNHSTFEITKLLEERVEGAGGKNGTWSNPYYQVVPIRLTKEWLIKFGFAKDSSNIYVIKMHDTGGPKLKCLAVYLDENNYTVAIVDYYTGIEKTDLLHLDYNYVHELQNLYFILTGQELILK